MANLCTAKVCFYGNAEDLIDLNSKLQSANTANSETYLQDLKGVFNLSDNCDRRTSFSSIGGILKKNGFYYFEVLMNFAWDVDTIFLKELVRNYSQIKYVYQAEETDNGFFYTNDYKGLFYSNSRYKYNEDTLSHFDLEIGYSTKARDGERLILECHADYYFPPYSDFFFKKENVDGIVSNIVNAPDIPLFYKALKNIFDKQENGKTANYIEDVLNCYESEVKDKTDREINSNRKYSEVNSIVEEINHFFDSVMMLKSIDEIEEVFIIKILHNYDFETHQIYHDDLLLQLGKKLHKDFENECTEEDAKNFCDYLNYAIVPECDDKETDDIQKKYKKNFVTCPIGYAWINDKKYAKELANKLIHKDSFSEKNYNIYFSGNRYEALCISMPLKKTFEESYFLLDSPYSYQAFQPEDHYWINSKIDTSRCDWSLYETRYKYNYLENPHAKITLDQLQNWGLTFAKKDEIIFENKKFVFAGKYKNEVPDTWTVRDALKYYFDAVELAGGEKRQSVSSRSDYFVFGEYLDNSDEIKHILKEKELGHIIPIISEDVLFSAIQEVIPENILIQDILSGKCHDEIERIKESRRLRIRNEQRTEKEEHDKEVAAKRAERVKARIEANLAKDKLRLEKKLQRKAEREIHEQEVERRRKAREEKKLLREQQRKEAEINKAEIAKAEEERLLTVKKLAIKDKETEKRLSILLSRLEEYFPEHKVFALSSINSELGRELGAIAKRIGYEDTKTLLHIYGYSIIKGDEVKELRNNVIYKPGNEPVIIKEKLRKSIAKLEKIYPSHYIEGSIERTDKKLSEALSGLYQWLGYTSLHAMLAAYGFKYNNSNSGGRPPINDYEATVKYIKTKYETHPFEGTLAEFMADNSDIAGKLKSLSNKSQELFGMTFKNYLISIGVYKANSK